MMRWKPFAGLLFSSVAILGFVSISFAQGAVAVKAANEIVEAISKNLGRQGVKELSEFGGEKAVQEVLERAAHEGGEKVVERVSFYGRNFGTPALKVIDLAPSKFIGALDNLPPDLVKPALQAVIREPEVLTQLVKQYGKQSLELAAKHPGVGTKIAEKLGDDGIRVGTSLSTDNAIRLARYSDDIAKLSSEEKKKVLEKIAKVPAAILDYLEKHPNTLRTAAGVTAVIAIKDDVLGRAGDPIKNPDGSFSLTPSSPGLIERLFSYFADKFYGPLAYLILLVAVALSVWCLVRIRHTWKISQIRQSVEAAKAEAQIAQAKTAQNNNRDNKR